MVSTTGTMLILLGLLPRSARWWPTCRDRWTRRPKGESAVSVAVREGAVALNVPDDGAIGQENELSAAGPAAS